MAPTICSGKKRQTRSIATSNIRRHGPGSHQLNQAFSNVVNFVAKDSRGVPSSLRIQTNNQMEENPNTTDRNNRSANIEADLIYNFLIQRSAVTSSTTHHMQSNSFLSDNAVTSSTHSDTENSLDLRLANEILGIDATTTTTTTTYDSSTTLPSSSSSSTSSSDTNTFPSHKGKTSLPTSQHPGRLFRRYSNKMQAAHKLTGRTQDSSDNEEADAFCESGSNKKMHSNKKITELHSHEKAEHFPSSYNECDSNVEELERVEELNSDMSVADSDTDLATDEADSMTSVNTEKSTKSKGSNHPLLSDKLFAKRRADNNNYKTKSRSSQRNTAGLLSIAIKTIKLVKRNQLLQQRLTQLQLETTEFIQSVLANPENRHFRENIEQKV